MFRTRTQSAPPAKTGLMSKVKTLFSSRRAMTKTTPTAKKPGRRNDADPRHQLTPEDLGKV